MVFLNVLAWCLGSYYVLSYFVFVLILWNLNDMYKSENGIPWGYAKIVSIPFIGFWLFVMVVIGDIARHRDNELLKAQNAKDRKGSMHTGSDTRFHRGGGDTED